MSRFLLLLPVGEARALTLLMDAEQTAMPDIQGVSCGAILSNYQRVRVEHMCVSFPLLLLAARR